MTEGIKRAIKPTDFADLIRRAQAYRMEGHPKIVSGASACRAAGVSSDWLVPLMAILDMSPSIAEAWADRVINESLDRAFGLATPESFNG